MWKTIPFGLPLSIYFEIVFHITVRFRKQVFYKSFDVSFIRITIAMNSVMNDPYFFGIPHPHEAYQHGTQYTDTYNQSIYDIGLIKLEAV